MAQRAQIILFAVNGNPSGNAPGSPPGVLPQTTTWLTAQEAHDAAETHRLAMVAAGATWAEVIYDQPDGEGSGVMLSSFASPIANPAGAITILYGDGIYWQGPPARKPAPQVAKSAKGSKAKRGKK